MDEKEQIQADLKAAQDKAVELETQLKAYKKEQDEKGVELDAMKKYKEDAEKRVTELEEKAKNAELDKTVTELASESAISPAMKPYVRALLGDEKKTYSMKIGDKDKDFSKPALLKELLSLHAESLKLNRKETSVDGEKLPQGKDLHIQAEKYAKDNKCSYSEAAKAVSKAAGKSN